jgi:hypothetical protein
MKLYILKILWDTMGCPERHKDLFEMVREDLGDMEGYWDTTERSKDIKGYMERDWVMADFLG